MLVACAAHVNAHHLWARERPDLSSPEAPTVSLTTAAISLEYDRDVSISYSRLEFSAVLLRLPAECRVLATAA